MDLTLTYRSKRLPAFTCGHCRSFSWFLSAPANNKRCFKLVLSVENSHHSTSSINMADLSAIERPPDGFKAVRQPF